MKKTILTPRERDVLQAVFDHEGNIKEAAASLGISFSTAKNHLHRSIFSKLFVKSACGAIRIGLTLNLIDLSVSIEKAPPLFLSSSQASSSAASNSDC